MSYSTKVAVNAIILMLGSLQFGFVLSFGGLAIDSLKQKYPNWDYDSDEANISYFLNFSSLFGSIGGFIIAFLCHILSAKKAVLIFNIINFITWLLYFLFTPNYFFVGIILRSIQGVITGGFACISPILMTNMATDDTEGMLGCINQFGIILSMVLFPIIATFTNFQILAVIAAIVDALQAGLIFIVPSRLIERNDKNEKNESIFQFKYLKNICIVLILMIFQQFCGINAINNNLTEIMSNTGIDIDTKLQAAMSSLTQLLSVFIASFNMDGIGRRNMWAISSIGIVIGLIMYIVSLKVIKYGWFRAFSVFVILLFFGHGFGPIPWFIVYDLFPRNLRLKVQTLVTFVNMLCSFGVTYLFPILNDKMEEYQIIIIFMCITFLSFPFGLYFIPKAKSIDDNCLTLI